MWATSLDLHRHPCFNADVKGKFGRVHLPVAPKCNIKCNYCNRKYDCVNESRPGVTSAVLSPAQAVRYIEEVLSREPRISVAGIAGPGDPLANPDETLETLRLIRSKFPDLILCLATNGFSLAPYVDALADLKVSHITVTVNAIDPAIAEKIYAWARDGKVIYRGRKAAELLIERQLEAIEALKSRGIIVKVNTIIIPGVNDGHVAEVARKMAELGVDMLNCMAMYPNDDTPFADIPEPGADMMAALRTEAEKHLPQMRHCTRCRADAVGLLGEDRSDDFRGCLDKCSQTLTVETEGRPYVAVATQEGILVNLHMGEAARFQIWETVKENGHFRLVDSRLAPRPGSGDERWLALAEILKDCRAILVSGIGERPREIITKRGIQPVEMNGFIEMGLRAIYSGGDISSLKGRRQDCAKGCGGKGDGMGCG
jgi:nitrogen fixation protein NifB